MGAPKQKWTSEEEVALKAGVNKYGAGKWSVILKDPEFSSILSLRSNVDLKDKWRNINTACGLGSRQRARVAVNSIKLLTYHDGNSGEFGTENNGDMEVVYAKPLSIVDAKPLSIVDASQPLSITSTTANDGPKKSISRLDDLILEAINNLNDPHGSNPSAIAMYIEEKYAAPPNLEKLLAASLKLLRQKNKVIKVKQQYKIAPISTLSTDSPQVKEIVKYNSDVKKDSSPLSLPVVGNQKNSSKLQSMKFLTKSEIEAELEKMRYMTAREAAAAAAQAVADAEAAIAEAEEAAREAEAAEAEAEAAEVFAEAALKALKCGILGTWAGQPFWCLTQIRSGDVMSSM